MACTINDLTSGMAILLDGEVFMITELHHVKPGKGAAFVRVRIRNVKTDAVLERTFRTSDKIEDVFLEEKEMEFLYRAGDTFHFMDHSSYEEMDLPSQVLGDGARFLLENLSVTGLYYDGKVIKVLYPNFIVTQITSTETGLRGDSTRAGTKPAQIQTGTTVPVPLFINVGDFIKIDTRNGTYVERVQK